MDEHPTITIDKLAKAIEARLRERRRDHNYKITLANDCLNAAEVAIASFASEERS